VKFVAGVEAADQPEVPSPMGVHPQLAGLEMLIQPSSVSVRANNGARRHRHVGGYADGEPAVAVRVGGRWVMLVGLTGLSIVEEAFDVDLNPIRARVSIGLWVLSVSDLPINHRDAQLHLAHLS
jgi:hypothetical protein